MSIADAGWHVALLEQDPAPLQRGARGRCALCAMCTMCTGVGQGIAIVLERV